MPIKLKVTDMVVGEIVFPVVEGRNLRANSTFVVNEDQFNHFTIQSALNKGFLTVIEALKLDKNIKADEADEADEIEVGSDSDNSEEGSICQDLNDEDRYNELNKNNIKKLKSMAKELSVNRYSKLNKNDLIEAIIEAEQFNENDLDKSEEVESKMGDTEDAEDANEVNKGMFIDLDEMTENTQSEDINPQKDGVPNNMGAWDAHKGSLLNKDDSSHAVRNQYNGVEQDLQTTQDEEEIDFSSKGDQEDLDNAFDEIKKKVASVSTPPKKKDGKKLNSKSKKSKSKGIKPVGEVRQEASVDDVDFIMPKETADDLGFVDAEQRNEAIRNHPVLGKKKEGDS